LAAPAFGRPGAGLIGSAGAIPFTLSTVGIVLAVAAAVATIPDPTSNPPLWWLLAIVLATPLVIGMLAAVPARIGARRPVARILQSELA
jgi:hypothetical protein